MLLGVIFIYLSMLGTFLQKAVDINNQVGNGFDVYSEYRKTLESHTTYYIPTYLHINIMHVRKFNIIYTNQAT